MARRITTSRAATLSLPDKIASEVEGWRNQGYHPFPSETTRQLLSHWFAEHDTEEKFHQCQRQAIETIIYLHEIRGIRTIRQLYEEFDPSWLKVSKVVADEASSIPFMKYCFKMATGSGKTWVLAALIVWQYFNVLNGETAPSGLPFSSRFLVVVPGLEVLNRLLDSFKGKRDPKTGNRDFEGSDYKRPLFMPDDAHWRGRFHLLQTVLEPSEIRANANPPDGPFVAIINWQQFKLDDGEPSLAEQIGLSIPEQPQGEIVADFLTEYPDLIIMNDEAHHVHGKKTARSDELVWRKFMRVLHERMIERHGDSRGLFLQVDFSATPFYGSGNNREYFAHIIYDYDLRDALNEMLVKQLFLEERQTTSKKSLTDLEFRAERDDAETGKRGEATRLSLGQKQLLDIGVSKLNQLTDDLLRKGLNRKPVLMILCEETNVADMVHNHLLTCTNYKSEVFNPRDVLLFHSELKRDKHGYTIEEARGTVKSTGDHPTLSGIDDDNDSLQIVVSVLALREGFDKTNISVICVLRATEADLLLEQIVGRGLRLMFPDFKYPGTIQDAKRQAFEMLQRHEKPHNSLDFLYIVEHPRFRTFYDELRREGYLIGDGDSRDVTPTGDLVPIEATPERIEEYDIAWPLTVQEEAKLPDFDSIDVKQLPSGTWQLEQVRQVMATVAIADRHLETDTRIPWQLKDRFFNFDSFIASTTEMIAREGRSHVLTGRRAQIAGLVDEYTTHRLFKATVDFEQPENYKVLAHRDVQDFVVRTLRNVILEKLGEIQYEVKGDWRRLSDLDRIHVRDKASLKTAKCIYPRVGYSSQHGGFERDVMREMLEASSEISAWCKLQRRHGLIIAYRDPTGLQRSYEVDFILSTDDSCFLLETKNDRDLTLPNVGLKARAAKTWCERITGLPLPSPSGPGRGVGAEGIPAQPTRWEYLLLSESIFDANRNLGFTAMLPLMRALRDQVIAQQFQGALFVQ
ncbi:MAG: DEAD/DEAH box helicase family protein [Phycisphaerales bacterium]|nr:DEAD/DEAH box helicase family protein [Phycisphaerales bacterium]MCI0629414.1 DEAD/DEAH box helicase family protein [Phycisphaerales bacterium]MCI0675229.1 DEAD/DEAH box helicase family protein [Phycisphaerales bacterium]